MTAAADWTRDRISGLFLAEASDRPTPYCPLDGSAVVNWRAERNADLEVVVWTGECAGQGHGFRVFND